MTCKGIADFLEQLSARGELARIAAPVDAELEIAEITRRVAEAGGPALLFEKVASGRMAVVTNLWGTTSRACAALGIDTLDELAERLEAAIAEHTPRTWFDRLKLGSADAGLERLRPKPVKQAACQQVVHLGRDVDLATLPLVRGRTSDSAPAITAGLCVSTGHQSQQRGVTRLPLFALDSNRLAVLDDGESAFSQHLREHQSSGERMPAAIVLGGDPALLPLGQLALPRSVDLWHVAGILRGRPLEVVPCRTHALEVPAEAELIFEGYFELDEAPNAATGTGPVFHVVAITQRTRAILPAIIEHGASGDVATLLRTRERSLLPQLRTLHANVRDVSLPAVGGPHAFAVVSLEQASPGHVRQAAAAIWGSDALRFTRYLAVVNSDVDVHDASQVLAAIGAHAVPERDVFTFDGPAQRGDGAERGQLARRMGIDATRKSDEKCAAQAAAGEETLRLVTARWAEYGLGPELAAAQE